MNIETIRAYSPGGAYLGRVRLDEAQKWIREKTAKGNGTKQKLKSVTVLFARASNDIPMGGFQSTYREDISGSNPIPMLKLCRKGQFKKWDDNLSFDELRRGRTISEATVAERLERRRNQSN